MIPKYSIGKNVVFDMSEIALMVQSEDSKLIEIITKAGVKITFNIVASSNVMEYFSSWAVEQNSKE